jgi:hypothetical protein
MLLMSEALFTGDRASSPRELSFDPGALRRSQSQPLVLSTALSTMKAAS